VYIHGGIFINDTATLVFKNAKVYILGSVFINGNATLVLNHATLYFTGNVKKPYSQNIVLSSPTGHPQLNVTSASIVGVTGVTIGGAKGIAKRSYSYGVAIYAYNGSRVTGTGLSLSRQNITGGLFLQGGPAEIKCYGESYVSLSYFHVESMFTYDEADVTVYSGAVGTMGVNATLLSVYNSSVVNLYGVSFPNTMVADNAHLALARCTESSGSTLTSMGHSIVDVTNGTTVVGFFGAPPYPPVYFPGINVTGDSLVYFSSLSEASATANSWPVVTVYDNATFVEQNGIINYGTVTAEGDSRLFLNNTQTTGFLQNIEIIAYNSSSIFISNCSLSSQPYPVTILVSDNSSLNVVGSSIISGYLAFSNNSVASVSKTIMTGSIVSVEDNASLSVASNSTIEGSIDMSENASLSFESSNGPFIHCPDSSHASFVDDTVSLLSVSDSSTVRLMNSTVQELSLTESNVTGSLSGLTSFFKNSTLTLSGSKSQVNAINATVKNLDLSFSGNFNVTISNSTLYNLNLLGSGAVTLKNASVYSGLSPPRGNSTVFLYSPLRVRCVDYFGNPLNDSPVAIVTGPTGTNVLANKTTDKNGWVGFVLFSGIVNSTGSFPLGSATIRGRFGGVSTSKDVDVAFVNKDVTLSFPLPWWSGYILPIAILVGIVALLVFVSYAYGHVRAGREKR
jgi:hypothetical protein